MLELHHLTCEVNHKVLLKLESATFRSGRVNAIVGPNGAGKSSLLRAITGELPCRGRIMLHQRSLADWGRIEKARHLACLSQQHELSFPFSAREVVAMGLTPLALSRAEARQHIRRYMSLCDCAHLANRLYPGLSGGEKQRVQLARILLQLSQAEQAPLLLLDEPTSAQDLGQQHAILTLARSLAQTQNFTVVAVLHDLNQVLNYADHCAILQHGTLYAQGTPNTLLTPERIETVWHYRPRLAALSENSHLVF